ARCPTGVALDAAELNALTIVCIIGNDYSSLLPLTARSMAASMLQTLVTVDRVGTRARMVGIELLSRGFATFKPYLDCRLIIQNLLAVLMTISEDGGSNSNSGGTTATSTLSLLPTGNNSGNPGALSTSGASTGLGIYRTMSGASLPALAGGYGTGTPISRNMSNQVRNANDSLLGGGSSSSREPPRPIPAPSGGERGGSLATTPTNTLSSVARAAMTSSALRAHAQAGEGSRPRLPKLGYGTDEDVGNTSGDSKAGTPSPPRPRAQGQRVSAHRHRSPRTRQSSVGDSSVGSHGSTVSFNLIVLA
ncbi:hypothetical protein GGI13_008435, partial [Coemansia sp. RSA 455]